MLNSVSKPTSLLACTTIYISAYRDNRAACPEQLTSLVPKVSLQL